MRPLRALTADQLRRRHSLKWSLYGPEVLPLWVAEMDAPLAEPVTAVLADLAATGDLGYPDDSEYAEAFRWFAQARWGWLPGSALAVADVMTGVVEALRLGRRDAVIVNPPVYPPFFEAIELVGARRVDVPLGTDWRLDLQALEEVFAREAGRATYLLCNPHNPTSLAPTREELTTIAALAARHDVRVVSDEIHSPLTAAEEFVPYLSVAEDGDAFAVTSASKAWNLAGAKAGLVIATDAAALDLATLPQLVAHGASQVGIRVQVAAWSGGLGWLEAVRADLAENRTLVAELMQQHLPAARYVMGEASYLAWLDLRAYELGDDPAVTLREWAGVALGEGLPFGGGPGFARLNYATTPEILTEALQRLGHAVA